MTYPCMCGKCLCRRLTNRPSRICGQCAEGVHLPDQLDVVGPTIPRGLVRADALARTARWRNPQKTEMFEQTVGTILSRAQIPKGQLCNLCFIGLATEGTVIGHQRVAYRCDRCQNH